MLRYCEGLNIAQEYLDGMLQRDFRPYLNPMYIDQAVNRDVSIVVTALDSINGPESQGTLSTSPSGV